MAGVNAFARAFWDTPPVTRSFMTASVATTLAVQLELISPFQLYFNPKLILKSYQVWRLITAFLYFGPLGFSFIFNLLFTYRYCRMLEEEFFTNRAADFFFMFLIGGSLMSVIAYFVNLLFFGQAFTIMLVYIWSRRNPSVRMNFFGLTTFQAPYLPWVLLVCTILLGSSTVVDLIGIVVGHFYYFFEDVFPNEPHGFRVLETPTFLRRLFIQLGIDELRPLPEDEEEEEEDEEGEEERGQQRQQQSDEHLDQESSSIPQARQGTDNGNHSEILQQPSSYNRATDGIQVQEGTSATGTHQGTEGETANQLRLRVRSNN